MRIVVFGATGMVGSAVVAEAVARGHHVTAVSRRGHSDPGVVPAASVAADVADTDALDAILEKADAAVLSIRLEPGAEDRLAPLTQGVLDVASRHGTRVLVVGGSAVLRSPDSVDTLLIDDPRHVPAAWRRIASASLEQFRTCRRHPYDGWVYLSPPAVLEPGRRTGAYRRGTTTLLIDENGESRISNTDLAIAAVDEITSPGPDRHFTVGRSESP